MSIAKTLRHMQAAHASDFAHLQKALRDAALRFSDLADIIEKEPDKAVEQVGFMRASAERFNLVAELED